MHLVVLYKSVITGLLWILLLSGALPSSYLSFRKEIKVLDSGFLWNLSLGTEACNKLVRVSRSLILWSCPLLTFIEQHLWGLAVRTADSFFPVWDVAAEENSEVSLALSTFFWPFTGLSYPFFYMENLAFLVGVSRKAEKSDFSFPSKTYVCGFISQMTEDLEMGPVLLRLISASQELWITTECSTKGPSHTMCLLCHFFRL